VWPASGWVHRAASDGTTTSIIKDHRKTDGGYRAVYPFVSGNRNNYQHQKTSARPPYLRHERMTLQPTCAPYPSNISATTAAAVMPRQLCCPVGKNIAPREATRHRKTPGLRQVKVSSGDDQAPLLLAPAPTPMPQPLNRCHYRRIYPSPTDRRKHDAERPNKLSDMAPPHAISHGLKCFLT